MVYLLKIVIFHGKLPISRGLPFLKMVIFHGELLVITVNGTSKKYSLKKPERVFRRWHSKIRPEKSLLQKWMIWGTILGSPKNRKPQ